MCRQTDKQTDRLSSKGRAGGRGEDEGKRQRGNTRVGRSVGKKKGGGTTEGKITRGRRRVGRSMGRKEVLVERGKHSEGKVDMTFEGVAREVSKISGRVSR